MSQLLCEHFVLDQRSTYPLQVTANRYCLAQDNESSTREGQSSRRPGLTLVFMHAIGSHKEGWEVTIQSLLQRAREKNVKIDDVFSIDAPNHGESAVLNEKEFKNLFPDSLSGHAVEYAKAVHTFLTAGKDKGAKIDFSRRRLVGIGHSAGAAGMFLIKDYSPAVDFEYFIACEPGVAMKGDPNVDKAIQAVTNFTWLRPDAWTSKKSARKALNSSPVYSRWDPRVLDIFIQEHGLRTHPTASLKPPFSFNGVTFSAPKEIEIVGLRSGISWFGLKLMKLCLSGMKAAFQDDGMVVAGFQAYSETTRRKPVHLVWGTLKDVQSPGRSYLSDRSAGRTPASVRYVQDAGHLVVQQKPEGVACAILDIIQEEMGTRIVPRELSTTHVMSKL
ncbi:hypothetical protein L218DRAFT_968158 [Marasmius fiardii PR-910]|nr:hypothetical protein L218DRAFT_968158 [Marasmius fiardii PR-910]